MKRYFELLLVVLIIFIYPNIYADVSAQYRGKFYTRANFDIYRDSKSEQQIEWRNKLFLEGNLQPDESTRFVISLLSEYQLLWSEQDTVYRFFPELYEAYIKFNLKSLDITAGQQNVSWGKADLSVNDVLTPFNMREIGTIEEEFLKIPVPMVRAQYYLLDDYTLEGIWIPFYYPARFETFGTDWSLLSPTMLSTFNPTYKEAVENGMNPGVRKLPRYEPMNSEFGIRISGIARNFDYSAYYFYTWEDITALYFNPDFIDYMMKSQPGSSLREKLETINLLEVASYYPLYTEKAVRESIAGADFSTTLLDIAIRGEVSLRYRFPFMDENLRVKKKTLILWDIGGDYMLPYEIYLNMEFIQLYIPDYDPDLLIVKRFINLLAGIIRRNFIDDKLNLEFRTLYNFSLKDWTFNLLCFYQITDNWRLGAGWQHFDGPAEESIFGFFKKNKNLLLQARYSF
jgi:hypothetical protein